MENKCKKCFVEISSRKKFCSHKCYWESKIGEKHSWGEKISARLKGKKKSPEHIRKVIEANTGKKHTCMQGDKHFAWKGNKAHYDSIHDWVARYKGREKKCSNCKLNDPKRVYHWANISGEYTRDLDDWIRLCVPCHSKLDKGRDSIKKVWIKKGNGYVKKGNV